MTYHLKRKFTVGNTAEPKPDHLTWCKVDNIYQVRSDPGGMQCRFDNVDTLTEARKIAKQRCGLCGWAEIFRWAESGTMLKKFHIATYERELSA